MVDELNLQDLERKETPITPTNNVLGVAVAHLVLAFNYAPKYNKMDTNKVSLRALMVENDQRFGDHVKITGTILEGEDAGAESFRYVVIHSCPPGRTEHTVRFINFGHEEEVDQYHYGELSQLVQDTINHIFDADF